MSELLGRGDCVKSLREDLVDVQAAVLDVLSRTGPVRYTSWKFPDKLACNVDLVGLLEEYDFVDGEDAFNQHSHVVLLELLVDRLLLLLQTVSVYTELQRGTHRRNQSQQQGCLSVGLVVRNYWGSLRQSANKENPKVVKQTNTKTLDHTTLSSPTSSGTGLGRNFSSTSFKSIPQNGENSGQTHTATSYSKAKCRTAGCQTAESSLIPCDACHGVQFLLKNTGDALIDLFRSEGLPSSLQPLSDAMEETMEPGQMTAADVAQWAEEQLRDIRRLSKHLHDVRTTVQPLREALAKAEAERDRFSSQLASVKKEFKQELEKHQVSQVQLEFSLQKAERSSRQSEQRLQEEQKQLKKEMFALEESNKRLKDTAELHQNMSEALGSEKNELCQKVKTLERERETCCKLQQRVLEIETQLSVTQLLLDKEKAKYQSACRQQESMQAKQKSLLERVDAVDEECEDLQRQLGDKEEVQANLKNELQKMSEYKDQQQAQLSQQQDVYRRLQKEKDMLQTHVDELEKRGAELMDRVQALRERERLLVAFPELNSWAQSQPQSTGNLIMDMEQQQQANNIRIKVLEQENVTLHKSLEKLRQRGMFNPTRECPTQHT